MDLRVHAQVPRRLRIRPVHEVGRKSHRLEPGRPRPELRPGDAVRGAPLCRIFPKTRRRRVRPRRWPRLRPGDAERAAIPSEERRRDRSKCTSWYPSATGSMNPRSISFLLPELHPSGRTIPHNRPVSILRLASPPSVRSRPKGARREAPPAEKLISPGMPSRPPHAPPGAAQTDRPFRPSIACSPPPFLGERLWRRRLSRSAEQVPSSNQNPTAAIQSPPPPPAALELLPAAPPPDA